MQNNQAGGNSGQIEYLQVCQANEVIKNTKEPAAVQSESHRNEFQSDAKGNEKDQLISKLQNSNRIITNEVQIIWQKLKQSSDKDRKRQKIINTQVSSQSLEKQLKNAYHLIKIIEKQIDRYKKKQKYSRDAFDRIKQMQDHLSTKEALAQQLKNSLLAKQRENKQLERQIIASQSKDTTAQLRGMTEQLHSLYQTVKEAEKREEDKARNLKRQFEEIKKIQKELTNKGISIDQLQQLKKKAIVEVTYKVIPKNQNQTNLKQTVNQSQLKQQQKRSQKRFDEMVYEIKILQKKQKEFLHQFTLIENQKTKYSRSNNEVQQRIDECEAEIEKLESLSEKLRSKHLFRHRKKQRMKSLQMKKKEQEKMNEVKINRQKLKQSYQKRSKRYKSLPSSTIKANKNTIPHEQLLKQDLLVKTQQTKQQKIVQQTVSVEVVKQQEANCDSRQREQKDISVLNIEGTQQATTQSTFNKNKVFKYGEGCLSCNKFNDRYILGAEHANKKIIELTLFFQPNMTYISGLSVVYEGGVRGGDYVWRTAADSHSYQVQTHQCSQGYIRDIYAQFEERSEKNMLIGVEIQLSNGDRRQFGRVCSYRSKLSQKQYVGCIAGSMSLHKDRGHLTSVIEQLTMTILMI